MYASHGLGTARGAGSAGARASHGSGAAMHMQSRFCSRYKTSVDSTSVSLISSITT